MRLWSDISRDTFIDRFRVVHVHGLNGHLIRTGRSDDSSMAIELIIFHKRYSETPNITTDIVGPNHRAFVHTDGTVMFTGARTGVFGDKYGGNNINAAVPKYDTESWQAITTQNGNPGDAYVNYSDIPANLKWVDVATLEVNTLSAAAMHSGAYLASASGLSREAVLPRSRWVFFAVG